MENIKKSIYHANVNVNLIVENAIQIKSGITINVGASEKSKNILCVEKDYTWNPATCSYVNGKYLASIIDDSVITCDEIIEETKTTLTKTIATKTVQEQSQQDSANKSSLKKFRYNYSPFY